MRKTIKKNTILKYNKNYLKITKFIIFILSFLRRNLEGRDTEKMPTLVQFNGESGDRTRPPVPSLRKGAAR